MSNTEHWRAVVGHEQYIVSDHGAVYSVRANRVLRPWLNTGGYPSVHLGRKVTKTVHAMVSAAFIGPRPAGSQVRHLDGNRENACVSNLAYGSASDNARDSIAHGTWSPRSALGGKWWKGKRRRGRSGKAVVS